MAGVEGLLGLGGPASTGVQALGERSLAPERADGAQGGSAASKKSGDSLELSPEAQRRVAELKATDARVRAHEAAHLAAAGGLAKGGASFTYEQGPDGQQYAVGGEVSIDTSGVPGNPQATLAKAQQIQRAALAPSDPSPQDQAVAAAAQALASQASRELFQKASGQGREPDRPSGPSEGAKGLQLDVIA